MLLALMEVCLERTGGDLDIVSQSSSWCMSWDRRVEGISSASVLALLCYKYKSWKLFSVFRSTVLHVIFDSLSLGL